MAYFLLGVGLVLVVEGALYALAPRYLKIIIQQMGGLSESHLRRGGLLALMAGVLIIWVSQNL